ncbi:zinc finger C2HC domain-containing protein 1C-like [Scomber scombrus]|uniref:Zinc finger C2HC domain-containing protein 1C-like n=1 Tax=Scomber scombrus TaxID=13677 RepID=A0AAV1NE32_SCOSC
MNTHTRGRRGPQEQYNSAEQRHCNVYTKTQHAVVAGGRAAGVDQPFPNKPVHHRRTLNPKMHDSFELNDFEKITISAQQRGPLSSQEHHSDGIRETAESQHPIKNSHSLPTREMQMARAIHAKELMLQEKLWRAEGKIRQMIQGDSGAAASDDRKSEEKSHNRGQVKGGKAQTTTRLREPVSNREILKHERRLEDARQLRKTQNQMNKDKIRNTHEEQGARRGGRETDVVQLKRNENKGPRESNAHVHKVSGELNRRKGEVEKAEQNKTSANLGIWTREKKYEERKKVYGSHDDDDDDDDDRDVDMPHQSQQKTVYRLAATENHRGAASKISEESSLPPVCPSQSNRAQQGELRLTESTDLSLQLLPCRICNRKFSHDRLKKHVQVCQKVKQSHRQVFNSYANRTKGSAIEQFWKNHSRSKTPPEVLKKKNQRQNHTVNTRTLHQGRLPAATSQSKWSK